MNTGIDILSASKHNIIIFPNPVTDIFFIDYENTGIDKVLIVNFAGITVLEFRNGSQINISQLPEGLYLVKIFDNNNICLATRKIVKQ